MKFRLPAILIILCLVIYSITAYYSTGFFHADEHFQIIEFAGVKAGWNHPSDMIWEFHAQMRPTLQPTLAYALMSLFKVFGISDPYTVSFLLREISAITIIGALVFFFKHTKRFIPSERFPQYTSLLHGIYLAFILLIWYVPYLGVRFSSETWSGIFLLFALGFHCSEEKSLKNTLLTGLFLGLSFQFRFQIAFAIVGFGAWFLLFNRKNRKELFLICGAFLVVFLVGIGIDSWFYGKFTLSSWNYFDQNILQNKSSEFGRDSANYYLDKLFQLPTKFIGILLILSLVVAALFRYKSVFTWIVWSFILAHMLVAHKEERFLFPIVFLFPVFLLLLFQIVLEKFPRKFSLAFIALVSSGILAISCIGIPVLASNPCGIGRTGVTEFIHTHYPNQPINLICTPYANPYAPWYINQKFYEDQRIGYFSADHLEKPPRDLLKKDTLNLLVTTESFFIRHPKREQVEHLGFHLVYESVSPRRLYLEKFVHGMDDEHRYYLYEWKTQTPH